ncbi:MAG: hypothetical protein QGI21_02065 [Candidatus Poseidoniaceae archaeon]|jgi:hypothetical protein|nr:hypothetical protein [Candidatus Poseidoniaceae archaeon]
MDEWSRVAIPPAEMWEELKKRDPLLDPTKFKTSDGRNWDIPRLNNAYKVIAMEKQKQFENEARIFTQEKMVKQQVSQYNQWAGEEKIRVANQTRILKEKEQQLLAGIANIKSKRKSCLIDLSNFNLGLFFFIAPAILQFVIVIQVYNNPMSAFKVLPTIIICNIISWISIPIMTTSLAKSIKVMDNRTKSLIPKDLETGTILNDGNQFYQVKIK